MKYVEAVLNQDEKIIKVGKVTWKAFIPEIIVEIIFIIVAIMAESNNHYFYIRFATPYFIVALVPLLKIAVNIMTTELALTDKKLIAKFGFIRRDVIELRVGKIESISVNQGIFGRILNYGTVIVRSAGSRAPIAKISNPMEFRKAVDNYLQEIQK